MTRLRAALAANALLAIVAFFLIATDWRTEDRSFDLAELKLVGSGPLELVTPTTPAPSPAPVKPVIRPKPPIAGPDLMTGRHVALSQFRGKPVFVSVWGSWNVGSLAQASTLARFARSHERRLTFLGVDSEDSKLAARAFSKRFHMDFPTIWDPIGKLGAWAPVPTTLVFDRRHVLVQRISGSAALGQLNAAVRRVTRR